MNCGRLNPVKDAKVTDTALVQTDGWDRMTGFAQHA